MGTTTIVLIIGGTIYAIKKSKDMKKLEEEEISVEEARAEVEARRMAKMDENAEEFGEMMEDLRGEADWNKGFMRGEDIVEKLKEAKVTVGPIDVEGVPTSFEVEDMEPVEEEEESEEDDELRHDPNSTDAREQYIRMELAEWRPLDDTYQTLNNLFDFPFVPHNDGDHDLLTRIIDHRVQFFGFESKWAKEVTFADIILYYARQAEFNCGESVSYWAEYFLSLNELDHRYTNADLDDTIDQLNAHTYYNEHTKTYSLFGLSQDYMEQAVKIANMNVDSWVTYEIEFNEFLKSCL